MTSLKEKIQDAPSSPGVYKFLDKSGVVLYVGKAKNLKKRLSQYFGQDDRAQIPFLIAEATNIDFTVTSSELEALFLENSIIKQYLPRYNIKLRDDKNYAFIKIDYSTEIPQITYARKVDDPKLEASSSKLEAKYFGPYSSARKIKQTLDLVRRVFSFCANKQVGSRPCFYYYLHRCPGVCVGEMSVADYYKHLDHIIMFLSGQTEAVASAVRTTMQDAAKRKQFEKAARLRDQLQALQILQERQTAMFPARVNWDFVSVHVEALNAAINLFKVRNGRLIDKENFIFETGPSITRDRTLLSDVAGRVLQTFLERYYSETSDFPKEIFIAAPIENPRLIEALIKTRTKKSVKISLPKAAKKLQLIKLGQTNAGEYLRKWQRDQASDIDRMRDILSGLQKLLKLPATPHRIEGYDISNIQGTNPVGSMVVFENGLPTKSQYRKFAIKSKQTPDDFAMMKEMLSRRLARISNVKSQMSNVEMWPTPDLIVIDGGKGQLTVATKLLTTYNLQLPVIGLAKRIEEIFVPDKPKPIILEHSDPILQLLQRLRDEAHRFAITFHRGKRSKQAIKSALDDIPGVGPKTKKLLKQKFGTVAKIKAASLEELAAVVGKAKAEQLIKLL